MGANLGLDDEFATVEGITGSATGWASAVVTLLKKLAKQSDNPFGDAATKTTGTATGNVPVVGTNGKLDQAIIPAVSAYMVGEIKDLAYQPNPMLSGWVACDGRSLSRTTYATLFAAIGTTYGFTSATTFKVPDQRRRVRMGFGGTKPSGSGGPAATIGSAAGSERHLLSTTEMPSHRHYFSDSATLSVSGTTGSAGEHEHDIETFFSTSGSGQRIHGNWGRSVNPTGNDIRHTEDAGSHSHSFSASGSVSVSGNTGYAGSSGYHNNVQPSLVVFSMIYTGYTG